jgi:hypothetical protein
MELTPETKPMLNTRSRRITFCGGRDNRWFLEKIACLEGAHEANKIMKDQIYEDASASMREFIRQVALTPLDTLLREKGLPRQTR